MPVLGESAVRERCEGAQGHLGRAAVFLGLPERVQDGLRMRPSVARQDDAAGAPEPRACPSRGARVWDPRHEALHAEDCELAVVGGVDSYLHVDTLEWLDGRLMKCGASHSVPLGLEQCATPPRFDKIDPGTYPTKTQA